MSIHLNPYLAFRSPSEALFRHSPAPAAGFAVTIFLPLGCTYTILHYAHLCYGLFRLVRVDIRLRIPRRPVRCCAVLS